MPGIMEFGAGYIRHQELMEALSADLYQAYKLLEENKSSQYLRRCLVRALFSYVEAFVESIKVELRSTVRLDGSAEPLSDSDKDVLGSIILGGSSIPDKFFSLSVNVKKTFKLACKIWGLKNFSLNTNGSEFQDFLFAINARNRLTHPKNFYDIEVTDEDMRCHSTSGTWIKSEISRLFKTKLNMMLAELSEEDRLAFLAAMKGGRL